MGFIGIFAKPRKYDFRSVYPSDMEQAMIDRVHKVFTEQGIDDNNIIESRIIKDKIEDQRTSNNTNDFVTSFRFNIVFSLLLIITFFIIYYFSN